MIHFLCSSNNMTAEILNAKPAGDMDEAFKRKNVFYRSIQRLKKKKKPPVEPKPVPPQAAPPPGPVPHPRNRSVGKGH